MRRTTKFVMSQADSTHVMLLLGAIAVPPERRIKVAWLTALAILALIVVAAVIEWHLH